MCGITGLIGWTRSSEEGNLTIQNMSDSLKHRGPDDQGFWRDEKVQIYFGHNRLSILDLSQAGKQPMKSSCGRYIITFNGEIYNHLEIRNLLEMKSIIKWRGTSDTETLIETISLLGLDETLKKIRGMFSFGLYDKKNKEISLVRDRFGEKPLYLLNLKNKLFAFASEISSFKYIKEFSPIVNEAAASCFFKRGWIAAPLSIWENITKVLPGHVVKIKKDTFGHYNIKSESSYWNCEEIAHLNQNSMYKGSFEDGIDDLQNLFFNVLEGQSLSDVPLGVFLSGGIDSSLISALMQKISPKKIKTFSIGFSEKIYDESAFAEQIAKHLDTEHVTLKATPEDALNLIEKMPYVYSEPFADSSQIPTTLLCNLVRKHVKVALTGDGGDELFTGYTRYLLAQRIFKLSSISPKFFRNFLSYLIKSSSPNLGNKIGSLMNIKRLGDKLHKTSDIIIQKNFQGFYDSLTTYWPDNTILEDSKSEIYNFNNDFDNIENMMLADQLSYLPNDLLVKVDRASMSVGLETRAPFLDHKVSEFAWSLPRKWRIDQDGGKRILREMLYKHVPRKLIDRPKQGFGMPVNEWLRGPLRPWAEDLISNRNLPDDGLLNGSLVRKTWQEHISGTRNWEYRLWPVLMWQKWSISSKNI